MANDIQQKHKVPMDKQLTDHNHAINLHPNWGPVEDVQHTFLEKNLVGNPISMLEQLKQLKDFPNFSPF